MATQKVRRLAALGDSLTEGFPFTGIVPWPQLLAVRRTGRKFASVNFGQSGTKVAAMLTQFGNQVEGQGFTHLCFFGGTNNFVGTAPEDTVAAVQTIVTQVITRAIADVSGSPTGIKVIMMAVAPRGGTTGYNATVQAKIDEYNAWIASLPALYPGQVYRVDTYAALGAPGDPTALNPPYAQADKLHFTQAGDSAVADAIDAANVLND